MERLAYDPKAKQQVKDTIYHFLYDPLIRHFKTRIDTLIERNTILGGFAHKHFLYKGNVYSADTSPAPLKKNRLMPDLKVEMDQFLADQETLNLHELPYVLGFLNQVLNSSSDLADYKRVLPESVHAPLDRLILSCPCRGVSLSEEVIKTMQERNAESISLMRQRLALNLLI